MQHDPLNIAENLMMEFAYQTGLTSNLKPRRYLWTDAFAVCNFLGLYCLKGEVKFRELALKLVDQVHYILGRHREDDPRSGWISGLKDEEARKHPTIGGLRIGKKLPERKPNEPFNEILEWERDGQYYHYLTQWMHALNRVSQVTGNKKYVIWAIELAKKIHSTFIYETPNGRKRIYWKMSIDLTYPLIKSMGQHDPLDGFITYNELQASAPKNLKQLNLKNEIKELSKICENMDWTTSDPLGVGCLLWNAYKLAKLIKNRQIKNTNLLTEILNSSLISLELYLSTQPLNLPPHMRLPFRELGLTIGLKAANKLQKIIKNEPKLSKNMELKSTIETLKYYNWLTQKIENFWLKPENRESRNWTKHKDINIVMLATSLIPNGYLGT